MEVRSQWVGDSLEWIFFNGNMTVIIGDKALKSWCGRNMKPHDAPNDGIIRVKHTEAFSAHVERINA